MWILPAYTSGRSRVYESLSFKTIQIRKYILTIAEFGLPSLMQIRILSCKSEKCKVEGTEHGTVYLRSVTIATTETGEG